MKKLLIAAACASLMCGSAFAQTGMNNGSKTDGMNGPSSGMDSNAKMMKKKSMKKGSMGNGSMGGSSMNNGGMGNNGSMGTGMQK